MQWTVILLREAGEVYPLHHALFIVDAIRRTD